MRIIEGTKGRSITFAAALIIALSLERYVPFASQINLSLIVILGFIVMEIVRTWDKHKKMNKVKISILAAVGVIALASWLL